MRERAVHFVVRHTALGDVSSVRLFPRRPRPPESYYRSRREDLAAGFAVAAGILAALTEGAFQWILIVRGVRRLDPARGLFWFMWIVGEAALLGALVGFAIGWVLGFMWERWHRRRRAG